MLGNMINILKGFHKTVKCDLLEVLDGQKLLKSGQVRHICGPWGLKSGWAG